MSSERVTPERKRTPKLPAKFGSVSTSRSYPGTCGFAVSDQSKKNGSDTEAPATGATSAGAAGTGAAFVIC